MAACLGKPSCYRKTSTCGKVAHPDLENPADGVTPMLNQLRCSLLPKPMTQQRKRETRAAEGVPDYYPPFAGGPRLLCGWDSFAPADCTWMELQADAGPNGEAVYSEVTVTRKELLRRIEIAGPKYNYHMFVNQWTSLNDKLRHETFDPNTEIDVTVDWAAGYKMMQHDNPKCSHGTTCNQYVALVLHSPGERSAEGGARPVQCDVWRIWSQGKGDAAWHQFALKSIAQHYKSGSVPGLKRILVSSDGQRSQFKGKLNLGATAELPHMELPLDVCRGIDCLCFLVSAHAVRTCDFKASHHGSGPVDNYGKDPRRAMDEAVPSGDLMRYNYEHFSIDALVICRCRLLIKITTTRSARMELTY